ncbi:MAG: Rha family transcriptional regulator [Arcobacteraceae bacterium]|jgi:phage regulator Rha-like protein|nr:Rha family transcriptional regulator [Arcobacteraceae bacterium]
MNALIEKIENEFRVSHRVVAEQTDNQEKSILDLVTRNENHFKDFGVLRFKIAKTTNTDLGNGRPSKTYYLNEQQATFLMTLLRNSPKVVIFKKALVKAFYELKEKVSSKAIQIEETYFEKIYFPHQVINIHDEDFRRVLYIAYGGKCFYTNEPLNKNDFHIDHIMPKSKGGKDTVANCVPCIPEYNLQKSDKLLPNSQNIIEAVLSCHADMVIELFNNIKTAKSLKSKHNRVTMQGLKKSIMKEFNEMYGEKVMALFYAEVFGIPYTYNDYEDQATVLEFLRYSLVNINEIKEKENFTTETYIYKRYKEYCLSRGNKVLRVYDFFRHLQDYIGAKEGILKDDNEKIIRTFNVKIKD